jgi:RimJ/RimL family protein N-acetyltransferase
MALSGNLFRGRLVRLAAHNLEKEADRYALWSRDSEYLRMLDSDPARPRTAEKWKQDLTERLERPNNFMFAVRTLEDDQLIGFVNLWVHSWAQAEAGVGIGMGEADYRGRGYGTDAMRLVLRYAFAELNLRRVTLEAFAHNARAIRSYEKAGFKHEGLEREWARRDGQRLDVVHMGILRAEWQQAEAALAAEGAPK